MDILACSDFAEFFTDENFIAILAITLGCGVGAIGIVAGTIGGILRTRAMETTKRELAAYVAEGTLDPDQAVALINAGTPKSDTSDLT